MPGQAVGPKRNAATSASRHDTRANSASTSNTVRAITIRSCRAPSRGRMVRERCGPMPRVLFLCVHNAGRSQMAAGWLRSLAGTDVTVLSAGSTPADAINPVAAQAMAEVGIDIASHSPQRWTDTMASEADIVVSMGCGDSCPTYPGTRLLEWDIPDPAGRPIDEVRPIRDRIRTEVQNLLRELVRPAKRAT